MRGEHRTPSQSGAIARPSNTRATIDKYHLSLSTKSKRRIFAKSAAGSRGREFFCVRFSLVPCIAGSLPCHRATAAQGWLVMRDLHRDSTARPYTMNNKLVHAPQAHPTVSLAKLPLTSLAGPLLNPYTTATCSLTHKTGPVSAHACVLGIADRIRRGVCARRCKSARVHIAELPSAPGVVLHVLPRIFGGGEGRPVMGHARHDLVGVRLHEMLLGVVRTPGGLGVLARPIHRGVEERGGWCGGRSAATIKPLRRDTTCAPSVAQEGEGHPSPAPSPGDHGLSFT